MSKIKSILDIYDSEFTSVEEMSFLMSYNDNEYNYVFCSEKLHEMISSIAYTEMLNNNNVLIIGDHCDRCQYTIFYDNIDNYTKRYDIRLGLYYHNVPIQFIRRHMLCNDVNVYMYHKISDVTEDVEKICNVIIIINCEYTKKYDNQTSVIMFNTKADLYPTPLSLEAENWWIK